MMTKVIRNVRPSFQGRCKCYPRSSPCTFYDGCSKWRLLQSIRDFFKVQIYAQSRNLLSVPTLIRSSFNVRVLIQKIIGKEVKIDFSSIRHCLRGLILLKCDEFGLIIVYVSLICVPIIINVVMTQPYTIFAKTQTVVFYNKLLIPFICDLIVWLKSLLNTSN